MRSFSRYALPITIHHSGDAELIFVFVPAKRHLHIGRVLVVDPGLVERECSLQPFARENDSSEICLLQKFHQPARDRSVMTDHIKQNRPSVADDHNLAGLRFARELCHRIKPPISQNLSNINRARDG